MKSLCLLILGVVIPFYCCYSQPREFDLNVSVNVLHQKIYETRANNFKRYFGTAQKHPINNVTYEFLAKDQFDYLKAQLVAVIDNAIEDSFFAALHIFYGIDHDTFKLMYVPVIAEVNLTENGNGVADLQPFAKAAAGNEFDNASKLFALNELGQLKPIQVAAAQSWHQAYKDRMVKDSMAMNDWKHFYYSNNDKDSTNDVRAILFPFKAIYKMFDKNKALYITHTAQIDEMHDMRSLKHSLAFSASLPNSSNAVAVASDLGTICPPGCSTVAIADSTINFIGEPRRRNNWYTYLAIGLALLGVVASYVSFRVGYNNAVALNKANSGSV